MQQMDQETAVITGATGGLGRRIAVRFLKEGVSVYLLGRNFDALRSLIESEQETINAEVHYCDVDLNDENKILETVKLIREEERINYLIHGAAFYSYGALDEADIADLDRSYRVNVRAPYLLTKQLLPKLRKAGGIVAFINSSVACDSGKENLIHYASTKSALKSLADCLRQEVNSQGVRVINFMLGKVATPMQKKACEYEGIPYKPEKMIRPGEAANLIFKAISIPDNMGITDLHIRPSVRYD